MLPSIAVDHRKKSNMKRQNSKKNSEGSDSLVSVNVTSQK